MKIFYQQYKTYIWGLLIIALLFLSKDITKNFYLMRFNKFILLLVVPFIISKVWTCEIPRVTVDKRHVLPFSILVFITIIATYIILKNTIQPEAIIEDLIIGYDLNQGEIIIAALYTIFINALCEEFFFRYFLLGFNKTPSVFLNGLSAILFSLYHLSIMGVWFSIPVMILSFIGLFVGGLIFNWVKIKTGSIINTYIIHAVADAAIMLAGLHLLNII